MIQKKDPNLYQFLDFISKIDPLWTPQKNNQLAQEYSLNRSVLPALIKLNRLWQESYDDLSNDCNSFELSLNRYKSLDIETLEKDNQAFKVELDSLKYNNRILSDKNLILSEKNDLLQKNHNELKKEFDNLSVSLKKANLDNEKLLKKIPKKRSFFGN